MEAQVSTHFDERDARAKNARTLVRMRITNERVALLGIGENHRIELGTCELEVWEREVPSILAMVETDKAGLEMAQQAFEVAVAKQALDYVSDSRLKTLADDELLAKVREGKTPALTKAYEDALKITGHSVQGEFRRLRGRDIKPLSEAKEVARDIPSPYQLQEVAHAKLMGNLMQQSGAQATAKK